MAKKKRKPTVKAQFTKLLGEHRMNILKKENRIDYYQDSITDEIEMNFLIDDNLGDTVIHFTIVHDPLTGIWKAENCADSRDVLTHSYEEMRKHVLKIADKIRDNGFRVVNLPE